MTPFHKDCSGLSHIICFLSCGKRHQLSTITVMRFRTITNPLPMHLQRPKYHAVCHTEIIPAVLPMFWRKKSTIYEQRALLICTCCTVPASTRSVIGYGPDVPHNGSTRKEVCGKVLYTFFPRVLTPRGHSIRQYLLTHSPSIVKCRFFYIPAKTYGLTVRLIVYLKYSWILLFQRLIHPWK